jgi:competence protein ComEC
MAVVAGVVFFAVRALLALVPGLTVGFPIKTCLFST